MIFSLGMRLERIYQGTADSGFFHFRGFRTFLERQPGVNQVGVVLSEKREHGLYIEDRFYQIEPHCNVLHYHHEVPAADWRASQEKKCLLTRAIRVNDRSEVERIIDAEARKAAL